MKNVDKIESFGYKQELKRSLSFWALLVYGVTFLNPTAPMNLYGIVVGPSGGMIALTFLFGAVAMYFTALSYSRMATEFPIAGSIYSYAQRSFNPYIGFVVGWTIMLDYVLLPAFLYLVAGLWLSQLIPIIPYWGWIIIVIAINTIISIIGIELTTKTNITILIFELIVIVLFVLAAFWSVYYKHIGSFNIKPFFDASKFHISTILSATSVAVMGYLGFDALSTLSEETKNPSKVMGKAIVATVIVMGALFVLENYMAASVWPNYNNFTNPNVAFYFIAQKAGGSWLRFLVFLAVIVSAITCALVTQTGFARLIYSMARDEMLPRFLAKVHPKYKTPYINSLLIALISIVASTSMSLDFITNLINFGALTAYLVIHLTVINYFVIRKKMTDAASLFKYLILPIIGFIIIFYVWLSLDKDAKILGFTWLILGIIYGAIVSKGYKKVPPALKV
ncbi:Putrescine importer [Desulfurella amilsii]|uniref:Putrescine importer n=1 Tax=Desulfurella amilsii TaxID=1562698 RepID=A0A1X4XYG6_9BACT|nr:amino acid permease [Desulfurella amilsii]OSS42581.1 Putrescine importer [Desulfurella amilsii]